MEDKAVIIAERHENINMLSALLEKVRKHDQLVAESKKKSAEIAAVDREIAKPMPQIKLFVKIICILAIVVGWIILAVMMVMNKKKYAENQVQLNAKRDALKAEYDAMCAGIKKYDQETLTPYVETLVPDRFPAKYAYNANAIGFMMNLMVDLRADTVKEAVNIYEEELRHLAVMNVLGNIASYSKASAASAARSAAAQEATAVAAAATAAAAAATAASVADIARSERRSANAAESIARR